MGFMSRYLLFFILISAFIYSVTLDDSSLASSNHSIKKDTGILIKKEIDERFFLKDWKIVAIGDSLTEGLGDHSGNGGYVGDIENFLEKSPDVKTLEVENLGIKGLLTSELVDKIEGKSFQVKVQDADIIFITIGGNDLVNIVKNNFLALSLDMFEEEQHKFEENLTGIFRTIENINPGGKVYYIGLFNPFVYSLKEVREIDHVINIWNKSAQSVIGNFNNVFYVPIDDIFITNENNLLSKDQFHPNKQGYDLIAERVLFYIENRKVKSVVRREVH